MYSQRSLQNHLQYLQDMEVTKMYINRGMDREDVVHIYNENTFKVKIMSSGRKGGNKIRE